MGKQLLVLQDTRQVQVDVLGNQNGTIRTECLEEFFLSSDGIGHFSVNLLGAATIVVKSAGELAFVSIHQRTQFSGIFGTVKRAIAAHLVGHGFFALD